MAPEAGAVSAAATGTAMPTAGLGTDATILLTKREDEANSTGNGTPMPAAGTEPDTSTAPLTSRGTLLVT